ncbi:expressed unknown protein [Seminavis robusta]|uniref:Protein kinase domain-containing protein n=1 Tax=Seminavis robusta TaxID=568900 RepID=A0A9N8HYG0_9STRA|nr:expressed unknown protein [Seminavis robusta]|eukprot:Sro4084_g352800.1 n/a (274) ;mRNA; f:1042-1863
MYLTDYVFDGLVPMAFGQGNTVLQYALRGSDLYSAKIGDSATIEAEVKASRLLHEGQHCPSVMPVFDSVKIDENRVAMISPFYPIPVSHTTTVNNATIVNVALCGLATVKAFSNKKMCHGDLKPSNMMFQAGNRIVVSVDFGSCVAYGNTLAATSPAFGMDCETEASLCYDLTCLAASIMFLSGVQLTDIERMLVPYWHCGLGCTFPLLHFVSMKVLSKWMRYGQSANCWSKLAFQMPTGFLTWMGCGRRRRNETKFQGKHKEDPNPLKMAKH